MTVIIHECHDHLQTGDPSTEGSPTVDCGHADHQTGQTTVFEAGGVATVDELLESNTVADLRQIARRLGVEISTGDTKREIAEAIVAAQEAAQ